MRDYYGWIIVAAGALMGCVAVGSVFSVVTLSASSQRTSRRGGVALATGGGRGIGKACALRFAELGADVAIVSRTSAPRQSPRTSATPW